MADGCAPFVGRWTLMKPGHRGEWKIVSASSFEPGEGLPAHAIDGDPDTFWHTRWSGNEATYPHELVIDMGKSSRLAGIVYTARQDSENGRIAEYEVYLSQDGKEWGGPAAKGRLRNQTDPQTIRLKQSESARFLKLVALSEVRGRAWATVAELDVIPAD